MKIVIHGVHRSGTSLTSSLLERAGFWYAEDEFRMPAQPDNPKGFWERLDVVELNDRMLASLNMNWFSLIPKIPDSAYEGLAATYATEIEQVLARLNSHDDWFLKDPRLSVTWPVWKKFVDATDHLIVNRHPVAVAKSLKRRDGIELKHGLIFWYHQTRILARSLLAETNVSHLEFSPTEENQKLLLDTINSICSAGKHPKLQMEEFDSLFDAGLINYQENDAYLEADYPIILEAWQYARLGEFSQLLALPSIPPTDLGWEDIDSKYALANSQRKADRDMQCVQLEIGRLHEVSGKLHVANEELHVANEELHGANEEMQKENETLLKKQQILSEQLAETKLGTLKIAREINQFMLSGQYLGPAALAKIMSKMRIAKYRSLHHALDMAKHGHPPAELERALPRPSNRYLLLKSIATDPLSFVRRLTLKRVFKGLKTLLGKSEDDTGIEQALFKYKLPDASQGAGLKIYDPASPADWMHEKIEFQETDEPEVSIVIPVYNNYLTTLACLHSIAEFTDFNKINYQVVIADDCSSDETLQLANNVGGLRIVRSESNLGFLKNCNHAISTVESPYVVLLNNDTNVQKGWLSSLHSRIDANPDIGVVGPMFVFPDGRLQEAGGIIFSDASGWNYGRLDNPAKPEYQFTRESDYISGACLMFRSNDWNRLGGFDQRYSPAYFEDADLCFAFRDMGMKVVYEPKSVVVHFEGISHGKDESSGIKRFQKVNRPKFLNKWGETLVHDHFASDKDVFRARVRGKNRKTVLVIDHYVPMYDRDAGSRTVQQYIQLMLDAGCHVIFMGENFYPHQPYTDELQSMGVEVLYGEWYSKNWFDWLTNNQAGIDCVYLNRPHVTVGYIDKIYSLPDRPRIVYYGHDLHFLRLQREAELGIKNESGRTMEDWKRIEMDIMLKADLTLYPSAVEIETIKQLSSDINVQTMPAYWFEDEILERPDSIVESPKLLFVGGFGHPPNIDALNWFLSEIFPDVLAKCPDAELTIIGSKCPPSVFELANDNIEVLGEVSDERLQQAYDQARIAVAPLRYGAGVKGKVVEAMNHGITVVTTPTGAEGLPLNPAKYLVVESEPKKFASALIKCLYSDQYCEDKIARSRRILEKYFSRQAALNVLDQFFSDDVESSNRLNVTDTIAAIE